MLWGIPAPLTVERAGFFFSGALHKHEEIIISLALWVGDTPKICASQIGSSPQKIGVKMKNI